MCAILTVPELTSCFRSEAHRTLHSINVSGLSSAATVVDDAQVPDKSIELPVLVLRPGPPSSRWQLVR
eukprot:COSAG06_NODE_2034_length_7781_cov_9.499089_3_plen_68_part_00